MGECKNAFILKFSEKKCEKHTILLDGKVLYIECLNGDSFTLTRWDDGNEPALFTGIVGSGAS